MHVFVANLKTHPIKIAYQIDPNLYTFVIFAKNDLISSNGKNNGHNINYLRDYAIMTPQTEAFSYKHQSYVATCIRSPKIV